MHYAWDIVYYNPRGFISVDSKTMDKKAFFFHQNNLRVRRLGVTQMKNVHHNSKSTVYFSIQHQKYKILLKFIMCLSLSLLTCVFTDRFSPSLDIQLQVCWWNQYQNPLEAWIKQKETFLSSLTPFVPLFFPSLSQSTTDNCWQAFRCKQLLSHCHCDGKLII